MVGNQDVMTSRDGHPLVPRVLAIDLHLTFKSLAEVVYCTVLYCCMNPMHQVVGAPCITLELFRGTAERLEGKTGQAGHVGRPWAVGEVTNPSILNTVQHIDTVVPHDLRALRSKPPVR